MGDNIYRIISSIIPKESSSSDDSDDEDDDFVETLLFHQYYNQNSKCFNSTDSDSSNQSSSPKIEKFDEPDINHTTDILSQYSEEEFRTHFRISKKSAQYIIEKFTKSNYFKIRHGNGKEFNSEKQILSFLWFTGKETSIKETALFFDNTTPTFNRQLNSILDFFYEISSEYIRFPQTEKDLQTVSKKFENMFEIKDIIGCISDYKFDALETVTLETVCDADTRFISIKITTHEINTKLTNMKSTIIFESINLFDLLSKLCKNHYYILGDHCDHLLKNYLLKPIEESNDNGLTTEEKQFNIKHYRTRITNDKTIEMLKNRFKQLNRIHIFQISNLEKFILACCVLHNICIENNDIWNDNEVKVKIENNNIKKE